MISLEDTVRNIVIDFITNEVLFTALDVSNTVKQTLPQARHREIRDVVRNMFISDIETRGWTRTPITVNLSDGTTAEALLYHPLSDSWDLDRKYDMQKRGVVSARPHQAAQAVIAQVQAAQTVPVAVQPVALPVVPMPTARTLWDNLFQVQPSLFPSK